MVRSEKKYFFTSKFYSTKELGRTYFFLVKIVSVSVSEKKFFNKLVAVFITFSMTTKLIIVLSYLFQSTSYKKKSYYRIKGTKTTHQNI